jgi:hypothetical protein
LNLQREKLATEIERRAREIAARLDAPAPIDVNALIG